MVVEFFCPRWGSEMIGWDIFLHEVKTAGYKGIEWFPYGEENDIEAVLLLLKKYDLSHCIVMTVLGSYNNFDEYYLLLQQQLNQLCGIGKNSIPPLFISAQVGREYFSLEETTACISCCKNVSAEHGIKIYQETHRNKWSYAAHVVGALLLQEPELQITLDISHWFCVSESYLHDQQEAVTRAIERTSHVHARVGHTQGSQVPDPALPQYEEALQEHLKIWDRWVARRKELGDISCSFTPEFGPPPYLVSSGAYVFDQEQQWDLNIWMMKLLDSRYNN